MTGLLNAIVDLPIRMKFETNFRFFVESVGGPEQRSRRRFADVTNQGYITPATQAGEGGAWGEGVVEADYLFHWHFQENEMMITKITHHTLHVDQRDRFTQHHFVKWTNKKRCEVENIK